MPTPRKRPEGAAPTIIRERVPFAEAIAEPKLLGTAWKQLSVPQQVILKAFYGLPLTRERELVLWSALQGGGIYDDLGYLTGLAYEVPYVPQEYRVLDANLGRRSGKSDRLAGFVGAYEATLGGHINSAKPGQPIYWLYVAQDLMTAKLNMRFILQHLQESPWLRDYVQKEGNEEIVLANGVIIRAEPPDIRSGRGPAVFGATFDEMAFWYKDAKAANPDFEVVNAIRSAMIQFKGLAKQVRPTTPWTQEGLAYEAVLVGTNGRKLKCGTCPAAIADSCVHTRQMREKHQGRLVVQAPTALMENPEVTRTSLRIERAGNPESFPREFLAQFIGSRAGFIDPVLLDAATSTGVRERAPIADLQYVAAMDPAFRHDSFSFTIGHMTPEGRIVQDLAKAWVPEPGMPLNPSDVLDEIGSDLQRYGLSMVFSDQYQLEALQQLAELRNFVIVGVQLTSTSKTVIMGNLLQALRRRNVDLLDIPEQREELQFLQKTMQPGGGLSIQGAPGKKDDRAMTTALLVHQAMFARNDGALAPEELKDEASPAVQLRRHMMLKTQIHADQFYADARHREAVANLMVLNSEDGN